MPVGIEASQAKFYNLKTISKEGEHSDTHSDHKTTNQETSFSTEETIWIMPHKAHNTTRPMLHLAWTINQCPWTLASPTRTSADKKAKEGIEKGTKTFKDGL